MLTLYLDAVYPLRPPVEPGDDGQWFDVCRSGTVYGLLRDEKGGRREVVLRPDEIRSIVPTTTAAIQAGTWPGGPPITANHARAHSVDPDACRRFGAVTALRDIDRDGEVYLQVQADWTEEGRALVESGAYAGISAELASPDLALNKDTGLPAGGWLLFGITLTNEPLMSRLQPLPRTLASEAHSRGLYLAEGQMAEPVSLLAACQAFCADPNPETFAAMEGAISVLPAGPTRDGFFAGIADAKAMMPASAPAVVEMAAPAPAAEPAPQPSPEAPAPDMARMNMAETPARDALLLAENQRLAGELAALRQQTQTRIAAERKALLDGWQVRGRFSASERPVVERLLLTEGLGAPYIEGQYPEGRITGTPAGHSGARAAVLLADRLPDAGQNAAAQEAAMNAAIRQATKMPGGICQVNIEAALAAPTA